MNVKKTNAAAERLESYAKTLVNHLTSDRSNYSEIRDVLNGKKCPGHFPSKESLAEMCLREVAEDIDEISAAFADLRAAIQESAGG